MKSRAIAKCLPSCEIHATERGGGNASGAPKIQERKGISGQGPAAAAEIAVATRGNLDNGKGDAGRRPPPRAGRLLLADDDRPAQGVDRDAGAAATGRELELLLRRVLADARRRGAQRVLDAAAE